MQRQLTHKEVHDCLLNILKEIDTFCGLNGLTYYLAYGTLIGAVRHQGFIPWDDDVDICMPRPDYEEFIRTFNDHNEQFKVRSHKLDSEYPYFFAKVEDTNTKLKIDTTFKYNIGLYVDIFPIDAVPNNKKAIKKYNKQFNFYRNIYRIKAIKLKDSRNVLKNLTLIGSRLITVFFSTKFLSKKLDQINSRYDYNENPLVSIAANSDQRLFLDKDFFKYEARLPFENLEASVPIAYDKILTLNYGNYMQLPPAEKRVSHHGLKVYCK